MPLMGRLPDVLEGLPDQAAEESVRKEALESLEPLSKLEDALGYAFARRALLRVSITLGSWVNEHRRAGWPSNACLEFYGDAVLGLVTADSLWRRFPDASEGDLTRLRASLVSEAALAEVARDIGLGRWLFLGKGDLKRGARGHAGTLADALEAVLGAVFLDARARGGDAFGSALSLFDRLFGKRVSALNLEHGLDAKSRLQQWVQSEHRLTPVYVPLGDRPPPDDPYWRARVELHRPNGAVEVLGEGEGRSLRAAEQAAARAALRQFASDG
jgi:ribonuclease-3